jgi:hypothetical protein
MKNSIAKHVCRLLAERDDGVTRAELIARVLVKEAMDGDALAAKSVLKIQASYDVTYENAWA